MLEEAYSTGVAILGKFAEQRESMKVSYFTLLGLADSITGHIADHIRFSP